MGSSSGSFWQEARKFISSRNSLKLQSRLSWFLFLLLSPVFFAYYVLTPIKYYGLNWLQTFDYGIIFESTYRLSRFMPGFLTTRGKHVWADNQDYFQYLLAPFHYTPFPHHLMLGVHGAAIFACGVVAFLHLRRLNLAAVFVAIFVWLSPFLANMATDVVHTEAYATVLILLMYICILKNKSFTEI